MTTVYNHSHAASLLVFDVPEVVIKQQPDVSVLSPSENWLRAVLKKSELSEESSTLVPPLALNSPLQNWLFWYPPMHSVESCIFLSTTYDMDHFGDLWIYLLFPATARTVTTTCMHQPQWRTRLAKLPRLLLRHRNGIHK